MPSFKDNTGREWSIEITDAKAADVKDAIGVDLGIAKDIERICDPRGQLSEFIDTLWVLCRGQHEECQDEDFGRSLAEPRALIQAFAAFFTAWMGFYFHKSIFAKVS